MQNSIVTRQEIIVGIDGKRFDSLGNLLGKNNNIIAEDRMVIIGYDRYCDVDTLARRMDKHDMLRNDSKQQVKEYIKEHTYAVSIKGTKKQTMSIIFKTYGKLLADIVKESPKTSLNQDILINNVSLFNMNLEEEITSDIVITLKDNSTIDYTNAVKYILVHYEDKLRVFISEILNSVVLNEIDILNGLEIEDKIIFIRMAYQVSLYVNMHSYFVSSRIVDTMIHHMYYLDSINEIKSMFNDDSLNKIMSNYSTVRNKEDYTSLILVKQLKI